VRDKRNLVLSEVTWNPLTLQLDLLDRGPGGILDFSTGEAQAVIWGYKRNESVSSTIYSHEGKYQKFQPSPTINYIIERGKHAQLG
jgi:hypothetical protein